MLSLDLQAPAIRDTAPPGNGIFERLQEGLLVLYRQQLQAVHCRHRLSPSPILGGLNAADKVTTRSRSLAWLRAPLHRGLSYRDLLLFPAPLVRNHCRFAVFEGGFDLISILLERGFGRGLVLRTRHVKVMLHLGTLCLRLRLVEVLERIQTLLELLGQRLQVVVGRQGAVPTTQRAAPQLVSRTARKLMPCHRQVSGPCLDAHGAAEDESTAHCASGRHCSFEIAGEDEAGAR